ncbi:hypothetical protein GGR39_001841 [Novosphingobium fluoreni]|uniref:RiboL-PSP-HEPN domain-containing protein n=1 Tax=Novosphingobium fluoreni TaxID=1391222 RepID=A0A7W6BYB5_9SPHN|nr:hypothetical protein [Novosphingobium fluoreni]MBB3940191.1 hypothetical protein [Novosphingobium fluoreni]
MTEAKARFDQHMGEAHLCLATFDATEHDFALRHIWIICVSAFDLYMTELVSEAGLRLIDRNPPLLTANLRQVQFSLDSVISINDLSPTERLLFYKERIYAAVQYKSFYKPDKVSEALSYIWTCPPKEKWARTLTHLKNTGRYEGRTEEDIRDELTLIGDRRELIAHSMDTPPGVEGPNPVRRADAFQVISFVTDLTTSIDIETESQLA